MFCRESCFKQSGDIKREENPTHYRNPREYFAIFDGVQQQLQAGPVHTAQLAALQAARRCRRVVLLLLLLPGSGEQRSEEA